MQGSENAQMLIVKRTGEPVPSSKIHTASSRRVHVHVCVHVCVCMCVHVGMCAAAIQPHLDQGTGGLVLDRGRSWEGHCRLRSGGEC